MSSVRLGPTAFMSNQPRFDVFDFVTNLKNHEGKHCRIFVNRVYSTKWHTCILIAMENKPYSSLRIVVHSPTKEVIRTYFDVIFTNRAEDYRPLDPSAVVEMNVGAVDYINELLEEHYNKNNYPVRIDSPAIAYCKIRNDYLTQITASGFILEK